MARSLAEIIKKAPKRVAVTTFSSNVARVKAVAEAAQAAGRRLVVAGRALHRVIDVAVETGYLPQDFRYLDQDQFTYLDRSDIVLMCTGSQGEPRAALARIAEDEHPEISLDKGDLVDLFLAHHSRQREGRRTHPERPRPQRLRYPHRQRGAGARLRPSAARRVAPDVPLDAAEDRRADARRGAPSQGAGRAGARDGRPTCVHADRRRDPAHRARSGGHRRRAGRPAVPRRPPAGSRGRGPGARAPQAVGRRRRDRQPRACRARAACWAIRRPSSTASRRRLPTATTCSTSCSTRSTGRCAPSPRRTARLPKVSPSAVRRSVRAAVNEAWGKKPICKVLVNVIDTKG